ncbi:MAG: sulfite exporter TauE/SafE family protein [Actinobacteria bacterium]|nr:sulfite exporter TauE/SafE family protein [Actinomycetota bacterium]MBU1944880.1 sulfite exporter TauE/SafE family protein [Actinomycetota bacterium]MBU2688084.1 sulfite exporter TauE/SafE family protein [Actinomycetota bacterium]
MPKPTRYVLLLACVLLLALGLAGTALAGKDHGSSGISIPPEDVEKVEVLYFHPRFRCVSCNNVEKYAREVTRDEFADEIEEGKLTFRSLEIDDPKNRELVDELGVTGSSLYVVATGDGKEEHREIKSVWLHWNDPEKCREIISSEIDSVLYGGQGAGRLPLAGVPVVLAAFLLGLLTAISPCPLATNIAALSYVSKKLEDRRYTVLASALYTAGRMVAYTVVGGLLILVGLSASRVSLFFQEYSDWILGPLLILFGLVMLDVLKISIFKGRITAAIQEKIGDWGLVSSFLLGMLFALAFCPYSAILFFGMLIPIAVEAAGGIALPAIYGLGTGLPVMIFAIALAVGVSEIGKHVARVQKFEKYFRWFAGVVFIGVGVYYLVVLVKSFF